MPIQVACSDCGKRYRFPDERAGDTVECKECGSDIEIPGGRSRSGASRGGKKKKKSEGSGVGAGVLIGGGVGAAVLVGVVVVLFMGRGQQPAAPQNAVPANNGQPIAANPATPPANANPAVPGTTPPNAGQPNPAQPNPAVPGVGANPINPAPANPAVAAANANARGPAAGSGFSKADVGGFKPVKDWKVQVDPLPQPLALEGGKKFSVKTVSGFLSDSFVTYPDTPSPFALVGQNSTDKESREVWNLSNGEKAGVVKGPRISGGAVGFSPDGSLVAWFRHAGGGGGIEVYDIKAKKTLGALAVDSSKFNVARVCLPTPTRLVALSNVHRSILTWKLPSGDLEWQITMGQNGQPDPRCAFSPGGRFLAVVADFLTKAVDIYDLDKGEKAGSIEFSGRGPDLFGMAFSRDGQELAAAYGDSFSDKTERIVIWNAATGAVVSDFELPDPEQRKRDMLSSKTSLQWFPDGKRLLLNGAHIIDRDSKAVVYTLPKLSLDFHTALARRVLTDSTIAAWEGTKQSAAVAPLEVKADDIARAKEVAAAGGLMFDAKLPKLTAFDRDKATDRSQVDATWRGAVDSGPAAEKLSDTIPLKSGDGRVREVEVSRPDVGIVCVRLTDEEDATQAAISGLVPRTHLITSESRSRVRMRIPPVPCRSNWLELYDAVKRAPAGRIDVDFPCELMAVSPDGSRVLVQAIDGEGRLDVFAADGTHVAGCRPFQNEPEQKKREIVSASFLDNNSVAACSIDDRLIVFSLPSCSPVYAVADAGVLVVSPGGKFIATCGENRIELRDALTGEGRGIVNLEADVQAMSFSPKGDRLAVLTSGRKGSAVNVIDMTNGTPTSIPVPQAIAPLVWCGDNEVILGSPRSGDIKATQAGTSVDHALMLVDLNRKGVLWSYVYGTADQVTFGRKTSDGRFWLAGPLGKGSNRQVAAIELPEPAAKKQVGEKKLDAQAIVRPGVSVSLAFDVKDAPGVPDLAQKARAAIEGAIKENGLTIKDGEPIRLVVSIAPANATGNITLQALGGGLGGANPPNITVQRKAVTVRIAYETGGKAVWESKHDLSNDFFGITRLPPGKDAQTVLDESMWQRALALLERNLPPSHVFPPESARGLGTSRLTGSGPVPAGR